MGRNGAGADGNRFIPAVEGLEDRTVPAGGIAAKVFDGVLYIAGDDASNMISVTASVGDNAVRIQSLDGTTLINGVAVGSDGVVIGGVKKGYHAVMGGGDDVLIINRSTGKGGVNFDMGDGNDVAMVLNAGHRGPTKVLGGAGNDTVELRIGDYRKDVLIDTGTGDDQVNLFALRGRASASLFNTGGTDFLSGQNFAFKQFTQVAFLPGAQPAALPAAPTADTVAPGVTLTSSTAALFRTGTADFTATFSEDVTGFTSSGIAVTNGTVTALTQVDARTYRFSVTPTGQGAVTAQVRAGAAVDASRNGNTASDTVSRTFDSVTATPTLALATSSDSGTVGDLRTDFANVALTGTAEAGSTVRLFTATSGTAPGSGTLVATTTAAPNGGFVLSVPLTVGPNSYVVRSTDAAGNVSGTFAQTFTLNAAPTGASQTITRSVAQGATSVDLATTVFSDAERVVRFSINFPNPTTGATQTASIDINVFADDAPNSVAQFLSYVNAAAGNGSYDASIFHRLATNFVLQGGGFKFDDNANTFSALTSSSITNEPGVSNTIGTIAFAKGSSPNSTNEFFFNLGDNSANLDLQNSGFTVFGQVMGTGLQTLATLNQLPTFNGAGIPGAPPFPVGPNANTTSFPTNINAADLINLVAADELTTAQKLMFEVVSNSNAAVATAVLNADGRTVDIVPLTPGTTTVTVRATDLDGTATTTTITVTVPAA